MLRTAVVRQARLFSTSPRVRKSAVETVQDAAKTVDRAVSDKIVKGIEKTEQAAAKVGYETGSHSVEELVGKAKGQASETAGQAKGKASELAGKAKGAAHETAGQIKANAP